MRYRTILFAAGIAALMPLAGCVVYDGYDRPYYGRHSYYEPPPPRWSYSEQRWAPSRWDDRYRRDRVDRP